MHQHSRPPLLLTIIAATLFAGDSSWAQMFSEHGGFIATAPTRIYAEKSTQSQVMTTLRPLDVVEILARDANDVAIRVKTHKTVH